MKVLILFVGWCILFCFGWPLALLALFSFPLSGCCRLPLRWSHYGRRRVHIASYVAVLPARLLGWRQDAGRFEKRWRSRVRRVLPVGDGRRRQSRRMEGAQYFGGASESGYSVGSGYFRASCCCES